MVYGGGRFEADGAVTVFADVGRLNMQRALTRRRHAIVAADAVVDDPAVIEYGRYPGRGIVAVVALIAR